MSALYTREEALSYHSSPRPGKIETVLTKPFATQKDLSLAYSPGVAEACLEIRDKPARAALYTGRSNLVAVISNGTAVLGLGDIGPLAGKPVMEGKGVLFKYFADIDVFDLEVAETDPERFCEIVRALEPSFGGINLEDIKAPDCFIIEERLKREMNIPVFHDDQHGTAVISGAAMLNACEICGRKPRDLKVVIMGAGAAGIACARFYCALGVERDNIFMFDSRGLIHEGRPDLQAAPNPYKAAFARKRDEGDLAACMKGAHLFLGLSRGHLLTQDMVRSMADNPVIFALANPVPEISREEALAARPDCIMGTGRSDYPNQINNVSGFPYIFRGALDVEATEINDAMKIAAARALADLARAPVPAATLSAYGLSSLSFGPDYVIPKPLDERLLTEVTPAVARAAIESGVARRPLSDLGAYAAALGKRLEAAHARLLPFIDSYRASR